MTNLSEIERDLIEIQSLVDSNFTIGIRRRIIFVLMILNISTLVVSLLLKTTYKQALFGDFLLMLGADFVGSTIVLAVLIYTQSRQSQRIFKIILSGVFTISIALFVFVLAQYNKWESIYFFPSSWEPEIIQDIHNEVGLAFPQDMPEESKIIIYHHFHFSQLIPNIFNELNNAGYIKSPYESYFGKNFINVLLLHISSQLASTLIIFAGINKLLQVIEKQRNAQKLISQRIAMLSMKLKSNNFEVN